MTFHLTERVIQDFRNVTHKRHECYGSNRPNCKLHWKTSIVQNFQLTIWDFLDMIFETGGQYRHFDTVGLRAIKNKMEGKLILPLRQ